MNLKSRALYQESGEVLEQAAQRGCGCPLPGSLQGQAGWGFEQPGLEGGVPAYSRGLELGDLKGPFQPKPFYDSMIVLLHSQHAEECSSSSAQALKLEEQKQNSRVS